MIRVPQVRVVDTEGEQLGVMDIEDARKAAEQAGLDLVEVAPQAKPPVCRIMDYGKYKYQMSKKAKEAKKKQSVVQLKEMKFRSKTDEHDFQFKLKNIKKFIEGGNKVKVTVRFRGREITHPEIGERMLMRIADELKEIASIESRPKLEGRAISMVISPTAQQK